MSSTELPKSRALQTGCFGVAQVGENHEQRSLALPGLQFCMNPRKVRFKPFSLQVVDTLNNVSQRIDSGLWRQKPSDDTIVGCNSAAVAALEGHAREIKGRVHGTVEFRAGVRQAAH